MNALAHLPEYAKLIRLNKQYGTLLVLLPALWALVLGGRGGVPIGMVIVFVVGAFVMRSAGCVINDIADRDFDGHVERTKDRPLAAGTISLREAVGVLVVLVAIAACAIFFLNRLAILMALISLGLALLYPFTKRFMPTPQFMLGLAFGWGIMVAWAQAAGAISGTALLIFMADVLWVIGYDTIYAMVDQDDDVKIGVHSTAIFFGRYAWHAVAALYAGSAGILVFVGWLQQLGPAYYIALAIAAALLLRQVLQVRSTTSRAVIFKAFESNVLVGLVVLFGLGIDVIRL